MNELKAMRIKNKFTCEYMANHLKLVSLSTGKLRMVRDAFLIKWRLKLPMFLAVGLMTYFMRSLKMKNRKRLLCGSINSLLYRSVFYRDFIVHYFFDDKNLIFSTITSVIYLRPCSVS